jgi:diguanylate cyclase
VKDTLSSHRLLAIIETLNEIARTALDLDEVMAIVMRCGRALTGAAAAVVEMVEGEHLVYRVASGAAEPYAGTRLRIDASLSGLCVRTGEVLRCDDAETDDRVDLEAARQVGAMSMLCVPLRHGDRVDGVLKVYDPRPHAFDDADVQTLRLLSGFIAAHIANATDFQAHRHASRHDGLTGLPNRRAFDERLAAEAARARRYGTSLALCMMDLDGFKGVNDTQGHSAGDEVLRGVAACFNQIRGEDTAFRFGGDEFAVLLPGATAEGARGVADRIACAVAASPACRDVGVSVGIAELDEGDPASLVERADAELYAAKRALVR